MLLHKARSVLETQPALTSSSDTQSHVGVTTPTLQSAVPSLGPSGHRPCLSAPRLLDIPRSDSSPGVTSEDEAGGS